MNFRTRRTKGHLPENIRTEVQDMCHSLQIEMLSLSPHLRSDIGLDCGCDRTAPRIRQLHRM
ncbi:MAG: hypothetical protein OEZ19_10430 [Paracoccaceae bacterium]|nr:hypothetical protein [Paracoccaceae bacterium]